MIPAMALLLGAALWSTPTADDQITGRATYYAPGLLHTVAETRGLDLTAYPAGPVALNRAGDLRRTVWLQWPDGSTTGPHLVADCAARRDFAAREAAGYVVEVTAQLAIDLGFYNVGPHAVTVQFNPPEAHHEHQPK